MTITEPADSLPRWSVANLRESSDSRSFSDAKERSTAGVERPIALFDELNIHATDERTLTNADGTAADRAIIEFNRLSDDLDLLDADVHATVSTGSRNAQAQSLMSEIDVVGTSMRPLLARLAEWVKSLGAVEPAAVSTEACDHISPLGRTRRPSDVRVRTLLPRFDGQVGYAAMPSPCRLNIASNSADEL
jgi:hypothetical protein